MYAVSHRLLRSSCQSFSTAVCRHGELAERVADARLATGEGRIIEQENLERSVAALIFHQTKRGPTPSPRWARPARGCSRPTPTSNGARSRVWPVSTKFAQSPASHRAGPPARAPVWRSGRLSRVPTRRTGTRIGVDAPPRGLVRRRRLARQAQAGRRRPPRRGHGLRGRPHVVRGGEAADDEGKGPDAQQRPQRERAPGDGARRRHARDGPRRGEAIREQAREARAAQRSGRRVQSFSSHRWRWCGRRCCCDVFVLARRRLACAHVWLLRDSPWCGYLSTCAVPDHGQHSVLARAAA